MNCSRLGSIVLACAVAACGTAGVPPTGAPGASLPLPTASPEAPAQPSTSGATAAPEGRSPEPSFDPAASGLVTACGGALTGFLHQAPELERQLPSVVADRELSIWSVRGECALELLFGGTPMSPDELLAEVNAGRKDPIDVEHVAYAIAGRADVARHPPYFVYAGARPEDEDEIDLNLLILLGGGAFIDVAGAARLDGFAERTIGGKNVQVGTPEMLRQGEHQRGAPYLYQTDDTMFLVVTDDEAWAEEALSKLP